jgi:hypothetical protein
MRIGITGHQGLTADAETSVRKAIDHFLQRHKPIVGISSLAEGADQIFADAVVEQGGQLEVILPCDQYENTFANPSDLEHFERLRMLARKVTQLEFAEPSEEAYWAAGREIVDSSELVVAVWNGQHSQGLGGTGDIVKYAQDLGKQVEIVWPENAARK